MKKEEPIRIRIVQKGDDMVTIVQGIGGFGKSIMAIAMAETVMEIMQKSLKEEKKQ